MAVKSAALKGKIDLKTTKMKHRLADSKSLPRPDEKFAEELAALVAEIKAWKDKIENSAKVQLAAKLGRRPKFSPIVSGEIIKGYITDDIGNEHLAILKKNPETYASRIAVAASTIRKGSGLSDQKLKVILLQAVAGNYNTLTKIGKNNYVDNISSVNLRVALRAQAMYYDAYINEGKRTIEELKKKASGFKEDVYKQQRNQILALMDRVKCNILIIQEYKTFASSKLPSEKEQNIAYTKDVIVNLKDFDNPEMEEKQYRIILQNCFNLVRIIRGCPLLYIVGHRVGDAIIKHGKYRGTEHPMGYFLKGQLYADEYILAYKEFEKCHSSEKDALAKKILEAFKKLAAQFSQAYAKINTKTEANLQAAIVIDFAEYLINFYEVHKKFLMTTLHMKPLSKEWINPYLTKTKNGLMSIDSSVRVEELYLKLENIGSDVGIPQY